MNINYIAYSVPVFFLLIMFELLLARWQGKKYYRFNDSITDLGCGIGQQVTGVIVKSLLFTSYVYLYDHVTPYKFGSDSIAGWIITFFAVDLAYYWWHRLSHEVNFLWAIHVVHHQSEDYNLTVALRQAWFSGISIWPFYAVIVLIGIHPAMLLTMSAFSTLYQFWIHTRTVKKMGFLEKVINTPALHRVHHARNYEYLDKNYAAILVCWDQIFGSYMEEKEEPLYGTVKPYGSWNPIWANFAYWIDLWQDARKAPYFIDKIKIWFKFPGWLPREVVKTYSASAPSPKPIRYNTHIPLGLNLYIVAHFIPVVTISTYLLLDRPTQFIETLIMVGMVLFTTFIWGGLFEKKSWAIPLELARLILIGALTINQYWANSNLPQISTATVLLLIGSAIWLLRYRKEFVGQPEVAVAA